MKSCQKVWVLAPTTLKSMGAEAPTAPILTGALKTFYGFAAFRFPFLFFTGSLSKKETS